MVTHESKDKSIIYCLEYHCPEGYEEFNIGSLNIQPDELAHLLLVYRERSGKSYKYDNRYLEKYLRKS